MKTSCLLLLLVAALCANGQFPVRPVSQFGPGRFRNFLHGFQHGMNTVFQPVQSAGHHLQHMGHHLMENLPQLPHIQMPEFLRQGKSANEVELDEETGGTKKPIATGKDEVYPRDCGRDKDKGTGLLCFPDGKLCQESMFVELSRTKTQKKLPNTASLSKTHVADKFWFEVKYL